MNRLIIFPLLMFVGVAAMSCGTTGTPASDLFVACKSFTGAEQALRPHKADMTAGQVASVQDAIAVAQPVCTTPVGEITSAADALRLVNAQLAKMLAVQSEVKP